MTTTITYRVHLEEPAIFTMLAGDPNSAVSYPYIPGSVMRGLLVGRQIAQHGDIRHTDAERRLFFSSTTRYLNAHPLLDNERSLPVPATWSVPKYKGQGAEDQITDTALTHFPAGAKPKAIGGRFTTLTDAGAVLHQPRIVINVHTARARRNAGEQQVFRYEALADGQAFMGAILCDDADAPQLLKLLQSNDRIAIGGSRTAGYGSATLSHVAEDATWQEVQHDTASVALLLTFLSDTLLRDDDGVFNPMPNVLQTALERIGITCTVEALSLRTTMVGGFNRKWGLPLPQQFAIERGSVVRLRISTQSNTAITDLQSSGIGERLNDGFGRVALGWQQRETLAYSKYEPHTTIVATEQELSASSETLWGRIAARIVTDTPQAQLTRTLYEPPATRFRITGNALSRTQIARLRSVIANALRADAKTQEEAIETFLTKIRGKAAGRQFANARITGQPLDTWLQAPTFRGIAGADEADAATKLALVDLVLERAQRERTQQAGQSAQQEDAHG